MDQLDSVPEGQMEVVVHFATTTVKYLWTGTVFALSWVFSFHPALLFFFFLLLAVASVAIWLHYFCEPIFNVKVIAQFKKDTGIPLGYSSKYIYLDPFYLLIIWFLCHAPTFIITQRL